MSVLNRIGWQVTCPPRVVDQHGLALNLLQVPSLTLRRLLEQAWLDQTATEHRHRKTMHDLWGIDRALLRHSEKGLPPLQLARLNALRSGAFLFDDAHSKFDLSLTGLCVQCGVADTPEHRICWCPRFQQARIGVEWVCQLWPELPSCTTHHLLAPSSPHVPLIQKGLQELPDLSGNFASSVCCAGFQHLFTDGSCIYPDIPELALASWGVVHAGTEQIIGCGPVPGLSQTIPRAELWAAICSLKWGLWLHVPIIIWSDSAYVVRGIRACLAGQSTPPRDNLDLWALAQELVEQYALGDLQVQHVPSHLNVDICESPLEEWLAFWNDKADRLAVRTNLNRDCTLAAAHQAAVSRHFKQAEMLDALFLVYSRIADFTSSSPSRQRPETEFVHVDAVGDALPDAAMSMRFAEELPVDWQHQVSQACQAFPGRFVLKTFEFLYEQDSASQDVYRLSWLELVVMFLSSYSDSFPVRHLASGAWVDAASSPFSKVPTTLVVQLRVFRHVLRRGLRAIAFHGLFVEGINLSDLGVGFPLDGVVLGCDIQALGAARLAISRFCTGRSVQRVAALARPFCFS